jgi:hypothetical protein
MSGNLRNREMASISALVSLLRLTECPNIENLIWIDGHEKGDGLPEASAHPYLLEHFTIDSTPNQRRLAAQFVKLIDGLEDSQPGIKFFLKICLPEDIAEQGRDWIVQRDALACWISSVAPTLADGHYKDVQAAGVDCPFYVWKFGPPTLPGVRILRWTQPVEIGLHERLAREIPKKVQKLAKHKKQGQRCLLIVESEDIALMNAHTFLVALRRAFPSMPSDIDNLWFCHTLHTCLLSSGAI